MASNTHLVTGYAGKEHVTSADEGAYHAAVLGTEQYVLDVGDKLSASIISNNKVRISNGDVLMQGRYIRVNPNTYEECIFDNGAQGYKRNDLIVMRYTKDASTGIEDANIVVIKGTPTAGTPSDPEYTTGDIVYGNATVNDFPLYRVPFDGLNIQPLTKLFTVLDTWVNLRNNVVNELQDEIDSLVVDVESQISDALTNLVKVTVAFDDSQVGNLITATKGAITLSKTVPSSKEVVFGLPSVGKWTFTDTIAKVVQEVNIAYYGEYNIALLGGDRFINVTYASEFEGKTITCTNGTDTQAKTASGGSVTFCFAKDGTYTISGVVSGEMYSTEVTVSGKGTYNATLQTNVTLSLTVYSAANDTVYYMGGDSKVTLCTTDTTGKGTASLTIPPAGKTLTLYSTVAKDTTSGTNAYSKSISFTKSTTTIRVMPEGAIYWYGYIKNFEAVSSSNGWQNITYATAPSYNPATWNTNSVYVKSQNNMECAGCGTKTAVNLSSYSKVKARVTPNNVQQNGRLNVSAVKRFFDGYSSENSTNIANGSNIVDASFDCSSKSGNHYITVGAFEYGGRYLTIHALWLE